MIVSLTALSLSWTLLVIFFCADNVIVFQEINKIGTEIIIIIKTKVIALNEIGLALTLL